MTAWRYATMGSRITERDGEGTKVLVVRDDGTIGTTILRSSPVREKGRTLVALHGVSGYYDASRVYRLNAIAEERLPMATPPGAEPVAARSTAYDIPHPVRHEDPDEPRGLTRHLGTPTPFLRERSSR